MKLFNAISSGLETAGRDALRLAIRREGGEFVLLISRGDHKRDPEYYPNRAQAWERARRLGAQVSA